MFLRLLKAELLKLREPMTLLTLLAPPGLIGALAMLGAARRKIDYAWVDVWSNMLGVWTMLLFPFAAVAFLAFAAQVEHRSRGWEHLLSLPAPKPLMFAAKSIVAILGVLSLNLLFVLFLLLGGWLGGLLSPAGQFSGPLGLDRALPLLGLGAGAALLMIAIQLWVSLRFSHFIAPIVLGVGGCATALTALVFQQADEARFIPWGLPFRARLAETQGNHAEAELLLTFGLIGGGVVLSAMIIDLSRREMR